MISCNIVFMRTQCLVLIHFNVPSMLHVRSLLYMLVYVCVCWPNSCGVPRLRQRLCLVFSIPFRLVVTTGSRIGPNFTLNSSLFIQITNLYVCYGPSANKN